MAPAVPSLALQSQILGVLVDRVGLGVFAIDPARAPLYRNRSADRVLAQGDGLRLRYGVLCAARPVAARAFENAIARAFAQGAHGPPSMVRLDRGVDRMPLGVLVLALPEPACRPGRRGGAVLLLTSDPSDLLRPDAARVAGLFGLTPAEARLATGLASGLDLEEYARTAQISVGTARWTAKNVFEKTGTDRQAELVRLLLSSVAALAEK